MLFSNLELFLSLKHLLLDITEKFSFVSDWLKFKVKMRRCRFGHEVWLFENDVGKLKIGGLHTIRILCIKYGKMENYKLQMLSLSK